MNLEWMFEVNFHCNLKSVYEPLKVMKCWTTVLSCYIPSLSRDKSNNFWSHNNTTSLNYWLKIYWLSLQCRRLRLLVYMRGNHLTRSMCIAIIRKKIVIFFVLNILNGKVDIITNSLLPRPLLSRIPLCWLLKSS